MGLLTDFIIAPKSEAQAICSGQGAHTERWPTLQLKGVDPVKLESLIAAIVPSIVAGTATLNVEMLCSDEDGPWVFEIPEALVRKLAGAQPEMLAQTGCTWAAGKEMVLARWSHEDCMAVLQELSVFFQQALASHSSVLLWMCL